ncbi:MAG: tetratricopeptide repeat protein [Ignavibacteriaceae bacterium]
MKLFLIILFLTGITSLYPQGDTFDSLTQKGIKEIYNIKFDHAETTFRQLMADYPAHPAGRFFLAMIDWWKILLDTDNETYDDIFFEKLEDVIYQCDEILDKEPDNVDALFFKGGAIGFRGRLRAYRESWIKAADDGREALPIVERASLLEPSNVDVLLGFGIYNYYASVIPEQYPLLKPLMIFFPSSNKEKGIQQLTNTAMNGKYAKYEARYFLTTLYYNYENNAYKASEFAEMLVNDFPDNPVFQRWWGRIAAKRGDFSMASNIFINVLEKGEKNYHGYTSKNVIREAAYYVGLQYRNMKQLDSAKTYFQKCIDVSKDIDKKEESGFMINAVLYLGMVNDLQGNRDEAVDYYEQLLDMREYGRSHSLAKTYLETPYKD